MRMRDNSSGFPRYSHLFVESEDSPADKMRFVFLYRFLLEHVSLRINIERTAHGREERGALLNDCLLLMSDSAIAHETRVWRIGRKGTDRGRPNYSD
jgi:hypothetical protein